MSEEFTFGRGGGPAASKFAAAGKKPGRSFGRYVLMLVFAGLVAVSDIGHLIAVFSAITVIGLPIALVMYALPTAGAFAFVWWLAHKLFSRVGITSRIAALLFAPLPFVAIPFVQNGLVKWEVRDLIKDDTETRRLDKAPSFKGHTFGMFVDARRSYECDELCRRFLLSGEAGTVIVANRTKNWPEPDFAASGYGFSLEKAAACEESKKTRLREDISFMPFGKDEPTAVPAMKARLADGYCLIARKMPVSNAEGVILHARIKTQSVNRRTLNPFAKQIEATRIAYYQKDSRNRFQKSMQRTNVRYTLLKPVLYHHYAGGAELRIDSEWARDRFEVPTPAKEIDFSNFLRQTLGLNLPVNP